MASKSNFSSLYKKGAIGASRIIGERGKRRSIERKEARHETVNRNRANLHTTKVDNLSIVVEHTTRDEQAEKEQKRREMLKKWKSDKDARKKIEEVQKKQKPTFRVAHFSPESISLDALQKQPASKAAGAHASSSNEALTVNQRPAARAAAVKSSSSTVPEPRGRVTRSGSTANLKPAAVASAKPTATARPTAVTAAAAVKPTAAAVTKSSSTIDIRAGRNGLPVVRSALQKPADTAARSRATTVSRSRSPPPVSRGGKNIQTGNIAAQAGHHKPGANKGKKAVADSTQLTKSPGDTSDTSGSQKIQNTNLAAQTKPNSASKVSTSFATVSSTSNTNKPSTSATNASTSTLSNSSTTARSGSKRGTSRSTIVSEDAMEESPEGNRSHVTYERGEASFAPPGHVFVPPSNLTRFDFELSSDSSAESSGGGGIRSRIESKKVNAGSMAEAVGKPVETEKNAKKNTGKVRSKSRNDNSFSPTLEDVVSSKKASGRPRRSRRIARNTDEGDMEDIETVVTNEHASLSRRNNMESGEVKNSSSTDDTENTVEKEVSKRSASRKRVNNRKSQITNKTKNVKAPQTASADSVYTTPEPTVGSSSEEQSAVATRNSRRSIKRQTHASIGADPEISDAGVTNVKSDDDKYHAENEEDDIICRSPNKIARVTNAEKVVGETMAMEKVLSAKKMTSTRRRTVANIRNEKHNMQLSTDEVFTEPVEDKSELTKPSTKNRRSRRTIHATVTSRDDNMYTEEADHTRQAVASAANVSEESLKLSIDSDESDKLDNSARKVKLSDKGMSTPVRIGSSESEQDSNQTTESSDCAMDITHDVLRKDGKENFNKYSGSISSIEKKSVSVVSEGIEVALPLSSVQLGDDSVFRTPRDIPMSARRRRVTAALDGSSGGAASKSGTKLFRNSSILRHKSPEEGVEILKRSPMVEMNRKPRRTTSSDESSDSIPMPDFSDMDQIITRADEASSSDERSATESAMNDDVITSTSSLSDDESVSECKAAAVKFRGLVAADVNRLNEMSSQWRGVLSQPDGLTEEADGQIRSVIGQTEWIMSKRFKQFGTVIDNCEFQNGVKRVTPGDLQGYYDVLYMPQVEEIGAKFEELTKAKEANWVFELSKPAVEDVPQKKPTVKQPVKSKPAAVKPVQSRFAAFRQKLAKQRQQESSGEDVEGEKQTTGEPAVIVLVSPDKELKTFDGGFFSVSSPVTKLKPGRISSAADVAEATENTAGTPRVSINRRSRGSIAAGFDIGPASAVHDDISGSQTPLAKAVLKKMTKRRSELITSSAVTESTEVPWQNEVNQSKKSTSRKSTRKTVSFMTSATPDTSGIDAKYLLPIADDTMCSTVGDQTPQRPMSPLYDQHSAVKEVDVSRQPLLDLDNDDNDEEEDGREFNRTGFCGLNINYTPGKDKLPRRVSGFTPPEIYSRRSRGGRMECIADEADESNLMQFSPAPQSTVLASGSSSGDTVSKTPVRRSMRRSLLHK